MCVCVSERRITTVRCAVHSFEQSDLLLRVWIMCVDYVCGLCVLIMWVDHVCGLCVWIMCLDYVCGLRVWIMCVDYVCGLCVWIMCVVSTSFVGGSSCAWF